MSLDKVSTHLIVGLGNPGKNYTGTRHNMGFMVADALAHEYQMSFKQHRFFKGEFGMVTKDEHQLMILKPTTYMNLSGESVKACMDFYRLQLKSLIVMCDDVDLPFGKLRLRQSGSSGGHNGLKSIEHLMGSKDFTRMRIGVGSPHEEEDLSDFVLGRFSLEEGNHLEKVKTEACQIINTYVFQGFQKALEALSVIVASSKKEGKLEKGLEKQTD